MWYVTDAMEIIMGPYETEANAHSDLELNIKELYFLDYYPNPYVSYIDFSIEDFEYKLYKWAEDSVLPTREKKVKVRREWR